MSRQARWIGCDAAKAAVPLMAISVSTAPTHDSAARELSRMVRARSAGDGGVGACAASNGAARQQFGGVESSGGARQDSVTHLVGVTLVVFRHKFPAAVSFKYFTRSEIILSTKKSFRIRRGLQHVFLNIRRHANTSLLDLVGPAVSLNCRIIGHDLLSSSPRDRAERVAASRPGQNGNQV